MAVYYVAVDGDNKNTGSIDQPFGSLQYAHDLAEPGDTIYLRGGTYEITEGIRLRNDGASGQPIKVLAYPGEKPVLDGSTMTTSGYWAGWVLDLDSCSWNVIQGIEICNGPEGGVVIRDESHNNVIEGLDVHHNGRLSQWEGKGISLYGPSSNNLLLNNDSHDNRDISGDNADGFQVSTTGAGNVLRGNRAWHNSDDGFDLFNVCDNTNAAPVTLEGNWAFENGYDQNMVKIGDGNGFKLGGARPGTTSTSGGHIVVGNMAWDNAANGFDQNGATRASTLYNNTAYDNVGYNYGFWSLNNVFANNLSYGGGKLAISGTGGVNSWSMGIVLTDASFASLDDAGARGPRNADGSLPVIDFLRPAPGSALVDAGTDIGSAYAGAAPDIGSQEAGTAVAAPPQPEAPTAPEGVVIDGTAAADTIGATTTVRGQALPAAGNDTIRGLGGNDVIYGLDGDDLLDGGAGYDRLFGGNGDDDYVVDSTRDLVDETGGSGVDTVRSSISVNLSDTNRVKGMIENVVLTGTSATSAQGNAADNVLTGNAAANTLAGMAGADTLLGGGGADTASYAASNAAVDVSLARGTGRGGHAEGDSLGSIESLTGSNYNDLLEGDGGANQLAGGSGIDTVSYASAAAGVQVNLSLTGSQQTGGAGADRLSGFENVTGSGLADRLTGNSSANILCGLAGNDRLDGGRGNDVLIGGAGDDALLGGSGADSFVFADTSGGVDSIADFATRNDRLQISATGFGGGLEAGQRATLVVTADLAAASGPSGDGYFIHDNSGASAGVVYWDATGGSSEDAVAFARLQPGASLSASDFWIV